MCVRLNRVRCSALGGSRGTNVLFNEPGNSCSQEEIRVRNWTVKFTYPMNLPPYAYETQHKTTDIVWTTRIVLFDSEP